MVGHKITVYCDGGARGNPGPAASSFVILGQQGKVIFKDAEYIGRATNNVAEYKAVIFALEWLVSKKDAKKAEQIIFFLDSQLIVNQLNGVFRIKDKKLVTLAAVVKNIEQDILGKIIYRSIPRAQNQIADSLVNKELDSNSKVAKQRVKSV